MVNEMPIRSPSPNGEEPTESGLLHGMRPGIVRHVARAVNSRGRLRSKHNSFQTDDHRIKLLDTQMAIVPLYVYIVWSISLCAS
jgi:hypothetical protein